MHFKTSIDLAIAGVGLMASTLFVSTDGNGQNPFPVLFAMSIVALVACIVSFALAKFVPTLPLAVVATIVITDLVFMVYFMYSVASREHVNEHAAEEFALVPIVFIAVTAPLVVLSSIGFGRIANRCFHSDGSPKTSQDTTN